METRQILSRLYRRRVPRRRRRWRPVLADVMHRWLYSYTWYLVLGAMLLAASAASHVYYYNRLVAFEFGVKVSEAQIVATKQKRNHIQRNLAELLRYYSAYERALMTDVTELRSGTRKSKSGNDDGGGRLLQLLARLDAVAEQYPNLHLNNTVQQFSETIVSTESEIAQRIMEYNNAVNLYTTVLHQLPGKIFAKTLGFEGRDFYLPEDPSILDYRVLDLPAS